MKKRSQIKDNYKWDLSIFCKNDDDFYQKCDKIEKKLPKNFVRCHKSYIANMDRIKGVEASENIISFDKNNHMFCSIGPKYKTKFMEELKNYGNIENHMDSSYNWK